MAIPEGSEDASVTASLTYSTQAYRREMLAGGDYISLFSSFLHHTVTIRNIRGEVRQALQDEGHEHSSEQQLQNAFHARMRALSPIELEVFLQEHEERKELYQEVYLDTRTVQVADARSSRSCASPPRSHLFSGNGFALLPHRSMVPVQAMANMTQEQAQQYYAELVQVAKRKLLPAQSTSSAYVFVTSHLVRREQGDGQDPSSTPIHFVHNDFTHTYKTAMLESFQNEGVSHADVEGFDPAGDAACAMKAAGLSLQQLQQSRLVIFNTWRSIGGNPGDGLLRKPLALCDMQTLHAGDDLFAEKLSPEADNLPSCCALYSDKHRWYYFPWMTSDELLVFKTYDSALDPFTPVLHCAFDHPSDVPGDERVMHEDEAPRISCEARLVVILPPSPARL